MRKKLNLSDFSFNLVFGIICIFSFLIVAYPLYFVVIASFSSSTMVNQGEVVFWIKDFSIYGYQQILADSRIWIGYRNTLFYSIVGTLINLVVTMPLAYTLSRKEFRFRRPLMAIFVFTMYFSGGLIPSYLLMQKLHLMNTVWVMMIPTAVNVYNLIIARSFMDNLPPELYEASQLDGCSHFTYFCKVVLPLSKAVISVLFLYYFVQHWNRYSLLCGISCLGIRLSQMERELAQMFPARAVMHRLMPIRLNSALLLCQHCLCCAFIPSFRNILKKA